MSCHDVTLMLSAYIDGETQPDEAREVKVHLAACPACAMELDLLTRTTSAVSSMPEIEPPAGLLARIEAATVACPKRTSILSALWAKPRYLGYAGASVAAAGLITIAMCVGPSVDQIPQGATSPSEIREVPSPVAGAQRAAVRPRVEPAGTFVARRFAADQPERLSLRLRAGWHHANSGHRHTVGQSLDSAAVHPTPPMVASKPKPVEPTPVDLKSQPKTIVTPAVTTVEQSEKPDGVKSTVAAEPTKPISGPITIARAGADDQQVVKLPQSSALTAQLRAAIAARNREKRLAAYSDDPANRAISVELASIRF